MPNFSTGSRPRRADLAMNMTSDPAASAPHRRAVRFANVGHFYSHVFMLLYPTVVLALEARWNLPYGELLYERLSVGIIRGPGEERSKLVAGAFDATG